MSQGTPMDMNADSGDEGGLVMIAKRRSPSPTRRSNSVALHSPYAIDKAQEKELQPLKTQGDLVNSMAHSIYAYSYSHNTQEIVSNRLLSTLRSLERVNATTTLDSRKSLASCYFNFNLVVQVSQEMLSSHSIGNYICALRNLFGLPNDEETTQETLQQHQRRRSFADAHRLAIPVVTFRRESATWLSSVSRLSQDSNNDSTVPSQGNTGQSKKIKQDKRGMFDLFHKPDDGVHEIVELLSAPYIDITHSNAHDSSSLQQGSKHRPMLYRRSTSVLQLPLLENTGKLVPNPANTCVPTPLYDVSFKQSTHNAVFTTSMQEPFEVRNLNDMACLMFGTTQSAAHGKPILGFFAHPTRSGIIQRLEEKRPQPGVYISGKLVDIVKNGVIGGIASLLVEASGQFLVWCVEELVMCTAEIKVNDQGQFIGPIREGTPFSSMKNLDQLHPTLLSLEQDALHYKTLSISGRNYPALFSHQVDRVNSERTVRFRLPRCVSGAIVIDANSQILDYNEEVLFSLLGIPTSQSLVGSHITKVIPKFDELILEMKRICDLNYKSGMVFPEHMFRHVACTTRKDYFQDYPVNGVVAQNQEGLSIFVDLELRILSTTTHVVWISFSRYHFYKHDTCALPSQLDLFCVERAKERRKKGFGSGETSPSSDVASPASGMRTPVLKLADESGSEATQIQIPEQVGRERRTLSLLDFDIIEKLGEGAYGKVVLARKKGTPKCAVFALKSIIKDRILVDTWTRDPKLGTIPNEIKVMNRLRERPHPNIVEMIDFFEDDEFYHVEMLCHGRQAIDLFDYIESNSDLTEDTCRTIFFQVVSAVAHLHHMGVVHRDIKDENIIIDESGTSKLIDFGSAAFVRQGPFDVFVGTVDYAAPEVLEGGTPYEGPKQDIWALGVLLYLLVFKQVPFFNVEDIMANNMRFPYEISEGCANLMQGIFVREFRDRPVADWILKHEWLANI